MTKAEEQLPLEVRVVINQLKIRAKAIKRREHLPYSQCLDSVAISLGFNNWSLLMKQARIHSAELLKLTGTRVAIGRRSQEITNANDEQPRMGISQ